MKVFDDNSIVTNILLQQSTFHDMFFSLTRRNDLLNKFFQVDYIRLISFNNMVFHSEKDQLLKMDAEWMNHDKGLSGNG